jgi:hypothetical protein
MGYIRYHGDLGALQHTFLGVTLLPNMSTEDLFRITVFANRNPKLSEDEFHEHWVEKHAPLVSSWLQRHGIMKYTQVRHRLSLLSVGSRSPVPY